MANKIESPVMATTCDKYWKIVETYWHDHHWKALEEHYLTVPLVFRYIHFRGNATRTLKSKVKLSWVVLNLVQYTCRLPTHNMANHGTCNWHTLIPMSHNMWWSIQVKLDTGSGFRPGLMECLHFFQPNSLFHGQNQYFFCWVVVKQGQNTAGLTKVTLNTNRLCNNELIINQYQKSLFICLYFVLCLIGLSKIY
jgi:hypothetical protein